LFEEIKSLKGEIKGLNDNLKDKTDFIHKQKKIIDEAKHREKDIIPRIVNNTI
jgi:vacuolar-type H+-ATPase subunit I/STV1